MTSEQEDLIIGRTVREYRDAGRRVAALEEEIRKAGDQLVEIGTAVRTHRATDEALFTMPDPTRIRELLAEYKAALKRRSELHESVQNLGVPVL
jgi:hypothetical protein